MKMKKVTKKKPSIPFLLSLLGSQILLNIFLTNTFNFQGTKVVGVIDGDTVVLANKSKVRLRHIDAPEKDLCGYTQATAQLKKLTMGKHVRIDEMVPDQYGRGMALVYDGDTLINQAMIDTGWVRYHSDQSSQTEAIKTTSTNAKEAKRGIYGTCQSLENTKNPDCIIKGNIDKNKYTDNKKYYLPSCAQYPFTIVEEDLGEQWFCNEQAAQEAGFTKAETCK